MSEVTPGDNIRELIEAAKILGAENDRSSGAERRSLIRRLGNALLSVSPPAEVEGEMVPVFYYEHDCDWVSKYCDENHRRSAMVPVASLAPVTPGEGKEHE